jgi:hypothetical protein
VRNRARAVADVPDHHLSVGNGRRVRDLAEESLARIPETNEEIAVRAANRHEMQNEEVRVQGLVVAVERDHAVAQEIADVQDHIFLEKVGDIIADPDRGIAENHDLNPVIGTVRSHHIDTGIEPDLLRAQGCMYIYFDHNFNRIEHEKHKLFKFHYLFKSLRHTYILIELILKPNVSFSVLYINSRNYSDIFLR